VVLTDAEADGLLEKIQRAVVPALPKWIDKDET
jgi:hypothetical protein